MIKLDHLAIVVSDWTRSRDWYRDVLGFRVEFEIPDRRTAAMQDDGGLTLFLAEDPHGEPATRGVALTMQVDDVELTHRRITAAGVVFVHGPSKVFWGWGAELKDPDGYVIRLWDETSMREKGG